MRFEFGVTGMTCQGCVSSLERALGALPEVARVDVDLAGGKAVVDLIYGVGRDRVLQAVRGAGFEPVVAPPGQRRGAAS